MISKFTKVPNIHIGGSIYFSGCIGSIKLQREEDARKVKIDSKRIKRRRREIRIRGMKFAEVSGNCCWEVKERLNGGDSKDLKTVENHFLPWEIKAVRLTKCSM